MKNPTEQQLTDFYFGALEEDHRLEIEKRLLEDTETLLDYLDLKREIEAAEKVPARASESLWGRLQPARPRKALYLTIAAGLAAAALAGIYMMNSVRMTSSALPSGNEVLFDSGAEHSSASNVL